MKDYPTEKYDVLVIGGGASGMMVAGAASANGKRVLLIEKNSELGKKLKITGGGRCNITNATYNIDELLSKFDKAKPFLYSPFSQFGVEDTFKFFEKRGLPLIVEEKNRAFPKTQKAVDVHNVMYEYMNNKNVDFIKNNSVKKINLDTSKTKIVSVETKKGVYTAKNYVIATGSSSHPETGSTGDGFNWLRELGHTVEPATPSIVPLKVKEKWVKELSGKSTKNMKITFSVNDKKSFSETGELLFTHFGLSGPLILNSSKRVSDLLHEGEVMASVDLFPDINLGQLEKNILEVFDNNKNKSFKNIAKEIMPEGLSDVLLYSKIVEDTSTKVHSVSKEERKKMANYIKALPITITGLMGMDKAVISDGGVSLKEIDTRTMKSKIISNLYLTGDILHINRPSGGYSLQLCWTTGYVAGQLK